MQPSILMEVEITYIQVIHLALLYLMIERCTPSPSPLYLKVDDTITLSIDNTRTLPRLSAATIAAVYCRCRHANQFGHFPLPPYSQNHQ